MNNQAQSAWTLLVAIAIPLLAILVPAFLTWAKDLTRSARRIRRLEEESRVIEYWEKWYKGESSTVEHRPHSFDVEAEMLISSLKKTARRELAESGKRVVQLYRPEEVQTFRKYPLSPNEFQTYRADLPLIRRALLIYRAPNTIAWLSRMQFHITLIEAFLVPIIPLIRTMVLKRPLHPLPVPFINRQMSPVAATFMFEGFLLCLAIYTRFRTARAEKNETEYYITSMRKRYGMSNEHGETGAGKGSMDGNGASDGDNVWK